VTIELSLIETIANLIETIIFNNSTKGVDEKAKRDRRKNSSALTAMLGPTISMTIPRRSLGRAT
jgi:hypothetical protein